jgi:GMP synthase (glutamine-hydrolysing)
VKKIVIIDYGSQYTQLIARKVREHHVFSEVITIDTKPDIEQIAGVILSGGPSSVYDDLAPKLPNWMDDVYERHIPILGICYGFQLLVKHFGGIVDRAHTSEYGRTRITIQQKNPLFIDIPDSFEVWMSHGDSVIRLPDAFSFGAKSRSNLVAAAADLERGIYGLQFHPEVNHTEFGETLLSNFLFKICDCRADWSLKDFITAECDRIRMIIGEETAICGVSGGVDSSVASVIVHKAIGSKLTGIFVNTGLLRKNEESEVPSVFNKTFGMSLKVADAEALFLDKLRGITDPEEKRKIIGETFIRVFESEAGKSGASRFLVQGTIYSDVIESAGTHGGGTVKIKSHHNVGGLPDTINFSIIEPLRFLFKDEVRKVGELLGIPSEILNRHPFPGPGLGIRCLGEITRDRIRILQEVDAVFLSILRENKWEDKVWQAFAVLLPLRSVGVVGDQRSYGNIVALRSVDSVEAMTADWSRLPYEILDEAARRITNEIPEVGRVVYDITSKPPATIEWE